MRAYGLCLALLLPLVGCSLTIRNPRACLFDGVSVCPSGMICDPIQNECVLPGTETEGGAISDGGSPADLQCTSRFCQDSPSFTPGPLSSIWGSGPSDVWVTEIMGAIDRFDGSTWTQVRPPGGPGLYAISGVNPRLIWAAGAGGTILLWNGSTWTAQTSPTTVTLQGIWAVSATQVWAVGTQGIILRYDGTSWSVDLNDSSYGDFLGIWAADQNSIWAVSNTGKIAARSGSSWTAQPSGTSSTLQSVYGTSANNVWAVGAGGIALRFDGSSWQPAQTGISASLALMQVFCPDASTAWAVGASGAIYRWSQGSWTKQSSPTMQDLSGVWSVAGTETWIIGLSGGIFHELSS